MKRRILNSLFALALSTAGSAHAIDAGAVQFLQTGPQTYQVLGLPGAASPDASVTVWNAAVSGWSLGTARADGSFTTAISGGSGDPLILFEVVPPSTGVSGLVNMNLEASSDAVPPSPLAAANVVFDWLGGDQYVGTVSTASLEYFATVEFINTVSGLTTSQGFDNASQSTLETSLTASPGDTIRLVVRDAFGNSSAPTDVQLPDLGPPAPVDIYGVSYAPNNGRVDISGAAGVAEPGAWLYAFNQTSFSYTVAPVAADGSFSLTLLGVPGDAVAYVQQDAVGNFSQAAIGTVAFADTPEPVDVFALTVVAQSENVMRVSGRPGTLKPGHIVILRNLRTGGVTGAFEFGDGSFELTLGAIPGDPIEVEAVNLSAERSEPVVVYGGLFSIKNTYTPQGYWHTGQGHAHTTASDGLDPPAVLEAAYYDAGYDFLISTDHRGPMPNYQAADDGLTPDPDNAATGKDLQWMPASELSLNVVHLGAWGHSGRIPIPLVQDDPQQTIDAVRANGGILAINHPENQAGGNSWDWHDEILTTFGYSMIEAFNGQHPPWKEAGRHVTDAIDLADEYRQVWWLGTDDCHTIAGPAFDTWAMVVQTDMADPAPEDLLAAADAGRFYIRQTASGPEILSIGLQGNEVVIEMADDPSAYNFVWRGRGNRILQQNDAVDTSTSYVVQGDEGYVRAEIRRLSDGKRAYTQPMFVGNSFDLSVASTEPALVDDDISTRWLAAAGSDSAIIDTGLVQPLNGIRIAWDGRYGHRFNYAVEASLTGEFAGEQIPVVRETYANQRDRTLDFFDVEARYLRIVTGNQSVGEIAAPAIHEVEVIDASPRRSELYVDNLAGDDENDGSAQAPWRSLLKAINMARPRDDVNVRNTGQPYGPMEIVEEHSGKHPGAYIRFVGDPVSLTEIDAGVDNTGIQLSDVRHVEIEYFDVHGASGRNIFLDNAGEGVRLSRNRIRDGGGTGVLASGNGFAITYNQIYDNEGDGVLVYRPDTAGQITNNLIYGNEEDGIQINGEVTGAFQIVNNILSSNDFADFHNSSNTASVSLERNCIEGDIIGLAEVADNISSSPELTAPQSGDFSLAGSSPCIDAGRDLGAASDALGQPMRDAAGTPNTGDPGVFGRSYIDIGAVEYQD